MLTQFHTITPLTQLILIPSHDNRIKIYFVDDYVAYFSQLILQRRNFGAWLCLTNTAKLL